MADRQDRSEGVVEPVGTAPDSVSSPPADRTFEVVRVGRTGAREALQQLASGMCGIVVWPDLLPVVSEVPARVDSMEFEAYDPRRLDPPILKVGPAVYDYYESGAITEQYWAAAARTERDLTRLFGGENPVIAILAALEGELGIPVRRASLGGRELHCGILREFPGESKMHYDELVREFPGRLDDEPIVQLAFNLPIVVPETGGTLTVWKHRWIPSDDRCRDGYGWGPESVRDAPFCSVLPPVAAGLFFDCRNFHRVGGFGGGRRITLSFFCGFTLSGELIVWS